MGRPEEAIILDFTIPTQPGIQKETASIQQQLPSISQSPKPSLPTAEGYAKQTTSWYFALNGQLEPGEQLAI